MNDIQIFSSPDFGEIRTTTIDNQPWFVGKDVASALGYANPQKECRGHIDEEDKGVSFLDPPGGKQSLTIINESGLYSLILSSKLSSAKKFKRWVTAEVLPAIRKTGSYCIVSAQGNVEQRVLTVDDYLRAASIVATCKSDRMPYVLSFLERGGFETPRISETICSSVSRESSMQAVRLMLQAKEEYGLSNAQVGRIVGLDRMQVSRYVNGSCIPTPNRAAFIVDRLTDALSQMEDRQE